MRYSNRIFLYGPLVLLLLIAAAVMVNWKFAADSFDARLTADNGREIMPGVRMSYASKEMEGFPFRVDSVMEGFTLQVQMRTGLLVWHAEHFAIHALTYGRNQKIFEAAGKQTLWWTDSDGVHHVFTFVPGSLRASAILADGRLSRFDLDAVGINSPELFSTRLQFHLRRDPVRDALDFVLSGDGVHLYSNIRTGFGDAVRNFAIDGTFAPTAPLQPLLSASADWRPALENWRRDNGSCLIRHFDLATDRLKASGQGEFALDEIHRPQGFVDVVLSGMPARDTDAKLAKAVSGTMAALSHYVARDLKFRVGLHSGEALVAARLIYPHEQVDASFPAGGIDPLY